MSSSSSSPLSDVLLYAQSKLTRKQAVREIADVVLRANMKPRTVQHALALLKILLPPENTLPSTVDELFGAMLSSENDWRLAQYLIRHKQQPSFVSTPNSWSEYSNSNTSLTAASSSSIPLINQEFNPSIPSTSISSLFLPVNNSSSSNSSSSSSSSRSSNSNSSSDASDSESSSGASISASSDEEEEEDEDEDDDDDDEDERNILFALREAQQQRLSNSSPPRSSTESVEVENHLSRPTSLNHAESSDQRSQLVSSSFNRYPFLGSFKRQRSETSSEESDSEPDLFYSTQLLDNESDDDDETSLDRISNNNTSNNNKSCCFEMNGCDLLDGGKRRRH